MSTPITVEKQLQDKINKRLRHVMPGMAITIDVYAQSSYGTRAIILLINSPEKLVKIVDKLLQNDLAKKIVISHMVKALFDECRVDVLDVDTLTEKCIKSPNTFIQKLKEIIGSRLKNGMLRC